MSPRTSSGRNSVHGQAMQILKALLEKSRQKLHDHAEKAKWTSEGVTTDVAKGDTDEVTRGDIEPADAVQLQPSGRECRKTPSGCEVRRGGE